MSIAESTLLILIGARGGSKGIPRKNILSVGGKPLISWTIEAALGATSRRRVIVTTDSPEIREISLKWGAEAPFLRPAEYACDDSPGIAPVLHAVRWLAENENYVPEFVGLLQPTSPLRTAADVDAALRQLHGSKSPAIVSVCPVAKHPYWMKKITSAGTLENLIPMDQPIACRQELPPAYALNGALYLIRREVLIQQETLFPEGTLAYIMPADRSIDIDSSIDLKMVDLILRERQS